MKSNKEVLVSFVAIMFAALIIFYFPMVLIWSMNNLFSLEISYNWKTWISVYIILSVFGSMTKNTEYKQKINFWK